MENDAKKLEGHAKYVAASVIMPHHDLVSDSYVVLERAAGMIKEVHCAPNLILRAEAALHIKAQPMTPVRGCICEEYWRHQGITTFGTDPEKEDS